MDHINQNDNNILSNPGIYRRFVESINDVIFFLDTNGYFIYINPAIEQMSGYTPPELAGKHFSSFFCDDDLPGPVQNYREALSGVLNSYEFCCIKKNGEKLHCRTSGNPLIIDKQVIGFVGVMIDISDKKVIEKFLHETELKYQLITDNIDEVIWMMDMDFNISYISPSCEKIRGYTPDELMKMKLHEHFTPGSYKKVEDIISTDLHTGNLFNDKIITLGPYNLEMTTKCNINKWHEIILTIIRGNNKHEIIFLGVAREITEKRKIGQALKISEEKFAKAFRYSPNIQILTRMNDCVIIDVSNTFIEYTGYSVNDVIGKNIDEIECWVNDEDWNEIWRLLKNTGVVKNKEFEMKDKNGFIYTVRLSAEIIYIDKELYIISTLFNLSGFHKLEKIIIEMSEKEKCRIAHELDGGLVNFLSGISILSMELKRKLDEKFFDESELAYDISNLINEAVSQIRALSRGLDPLQPGDNSIVDSLESLTASIRNVSGINCILSKGNSIPQIDRTLARNILVIAKKAINIAVRLRDPSNIFLTLDYKENQLKLIVRDDGIIVKDIKSEISYIEMKHIAGLINATLEFNYRENTNSFICIVNFNSFDKSKDVKKIDVEQIRKKRIIIVDDQSLVRQGLKKILEDTGRYEICGEADNHTNLIKAIRKLNPDLLICDFFLNDTYNIDLCRSISSINPSLFVLIITNQDELIYAEKMIKTGARGYIMKTETPKRIIEAVYTVMKGEIYVSKQFSANIASQIRSSNYSQQDLIINTLSERELEVFTMIGKGLHSKEIAVKLFISIKAVEAIRKRLRMKLKLSNSNSLVKLAINWVSNQNHKSIFP